MKKYFNKSKAMVLDEIGGFSGVLYIFAPKVV
jgi:hypothetical protein